MPTPPAANTTGTTVFSSNAGAAYCACSTPLYLLYLLYLLTATYFAYSTYLLLPAYFYLLYLLHLLCLHLLVSLGVPPGIPRASRWAYYSYFQCY